MSKEEASKGGEAAKEEKAKPEVGQMRKGDYMIHVFIEVARQLKVPEGQTVDPIVEVTCMNERKFTTAKDDIGATGVVKWSEHLFFEPRNVSVESIEQAKISLKLMDKGIFKDALIGIYEFDVAYIYFMNPEHVLLHKWVALSNPASENFNEVTGYLKLSISVACTGDEQIQIQEDNGSGGDEESVMMPPSIRPEYYQLTFRFFKAEKLPIMDAAFLGKGGSIDAYIICNYLNQKLKTSVQTMKNDVVFWNQEFLIPVQLPIMSSRLVMKLFDEDKIKDEIVGCIVFNLKDFIDQKSGQKTSKFFWKNVYGAPLGKSGENTNMMNNNPDMASTWKGRILMQVVAEKTEKPLIRCQDMDEPTQIIANPYMVPREYEIIAEVGQGIALPAAHKYSVKIKIGDFELKTGPPVFCENTYNRWNMRFPKTTLTVPYIDLYDMGRIFFYLMDGDNPVCFFKDDVENWLDPDCKMKWLELNPDLSIGKVTEPHKAGLISVKVSIHDKTTNGSIDFAKFPAWKKPPPKRPQNYKVRVFLFQCRDLPAADSDGQSDPYVCVWDTSKTVQKTKYIEDNVNPLFYETIELQVEANTREDLPPFVLDIYDKDFGPLDGDDYICRALIFDKDAAVSEDDTVPKPKWHPCRLKQGSPECGEILVSFSIVADDYNFKTPLNYMDLMETVVFDDYTVEITILGLRDLQSVGILPTKKAFIQFSLKSLVPPTCSQKIDNIQTQPGPAGPNPTINTMIKFTIPLPGDPLYCPRLQCSVFDNIFKGFMQPLIGVFTLPIGDILQREQKERQEEIEGLQKIIDELDKIMQEQGVVSYNIQEQAIEAEEDETFRSSYQKQREKLHESFTKDKKKEEKKEINETLFAPLLMNLDSDEQNEEYEWELKQQEAGKRKMTMKKVDPKPPTPKKQIEEEKKASETPTRTPRRTPREIANASMAPATSEKKKGGGILSSPLTFFNKLTGVNKAEKMKEMKEEEERIKREEQQQREKELEDMKRQGVNPYKNIVRPQYKFDDLLQVYREISAPPASLYIGLGFDDTPEDKRRHYRRFYADELENVKELMPNPSPFDSYNLKRGQTRGASKGWWPFAQQKEDESGEANTEQVVGKFKCIIDIDSEREKKQHEEEKQSKLHELKTKLNAISLKKEKKPVEFKMEKLDSQEGRMKFKLQMDNLGLGHLDITKFLAGMQAQQTLKRLLLTKSTCIVRLYMISAYDLASRDNNSPSDPYLYLTLGKKIYNERDNYILDEPNPDFYKMYDFDATFPDCPLLNIQVYDFDDLFGDDLIGETKVDLEDRFFSSEWQSIANKPIEYRQLYHPSSSISQGVVKMWVEIMPSSATDFETFQIAPRPPEEFEVRVCIFDTLDIKMMDDEGTSDAYIRAFFDSREETKETDTHFRCQDGRASFNYRFIFSVKHPRKDYNLAIQAYDRDFFKSNDIIGEGKVNLRQAFEDCALSKRPISLNKKYFEMVMKKNMPKDFKMEFKDDNSFFVQLTGLNEKGKVENTGKVRIQVDILPKSYAEQNKVGEARQEPNINPFLPPPVGRISFTLNPLKMFQQMVGPALRRKIYCYCCLAICIAICIMCAPMILSTLLTKLLLWPLGLD